MVSSNHSFWCSALASRTPHRRMWENSSSRACSKGVGVDILRGSARFLAMPRDAPLGSGRERGGAPDARPRQAADQIPPAMKHRATDGVNRGPPGRGRRGAAGARGAGGIRRGRGRRTVEGSGRMKGFYLLLVGVAVVGGGVLWYGSQRTAAPAPSGPVPVAAADGFRGYTLGSDSAPIEIVEYSDFECPFCASFATVQMPAIREQLIATGKVRWRYRDFPLPSHQYSRYAALAAQCAGEQGKFWEMHDQLFTNHQWAQTGKNPR